MTSQCYHCGTAIVPGVVAHAADCPLINGDETFPYDIPGITSFNFQYDIPGITSINYPTSPHYSGWYPEVILAVDNAEVKATRIGWECPVCHRGLAGWVAVCPCYKQQDPTAHEVKQAREHGEFQSRLFTYCEFCGTEMVIESLDEMPECITCKNRKDYVDEN